MKLTVFYDHIREAADQTEKTVEEICGLIKSYGISGVELNLMDYQENGEQIISMLGQSGLQVSSMYGFFDFGHETWKNIEWQVEEYLTAAKKSGASFILVVPGFLHKDEWNPGSAGCQKCVRSMKKAVEYLCHRAKSFEIQVAMEDFDGKEAPFATKRQLLSFLEDIPELNCAFDTGNFLYSGEDALEAYWECKPYISYVHCKDRTFEPKVGETPKVAVDGRAMYSAPVGSGCIPMKEIVSDLLFSGYDGVFAIEHFGALDQLEFIRRSAEWLTKLIKTVKNDN